MSRLLAEARRTNERRLLVVAGSRSAGVRRCRAVLETIDVGISETVFVGEADDFRCAQVSPTRSQELMGTTHTVVIADLHAGSIPNVIGRATGAVDGGGLLVLLSPPFADWPAHRDTFDESLVVRPFDRDDVRGAFKRRLVATLSTHPGIAVVDADADDIIRDGLTGDPPFARSSPPVAPPRSAGFPEAIYERCRTRDQRRVVERFEDLRVGEHVIVVSAERGRGKSSAAGLAAGALAAEGCSVTVTAPDPANTFALFDRAREALADLDHPDLGSPGSTDPVSTRAGGEIAYREPLDAADEAEEGILDVIFVDEAAGLSVATLERYLSADRVGFMTTRHGYEGSGHGFGIRFRETLRTTRHTVTDCQMRTPIRYAPEDPIEAWANWTLALDAVPPPADVVRDATVDSVQYRRISPVELEEDEWCLRAVMGLLSRAHYRTEPDDLARVLDAPNLSVVALEHDESVVCVALLAREGGLSRASRERAYRGKRLRGNLIPDILFNVFRDPDAPAHPGARIVRIATHPAVRNRGLGSTLIAAIRDDLTDEVSWVGTGFGATPRLVRFWAANGYHPITVSASRNRASGAHSVIMLDEEFPGRPAFVTRYGDGFPRRFRASLPDVHRDIDPPTVLALFRAARTPAPLALDATAWRRLVAAADGPGRYDLDPDPARELVVHAFTQSTRLEAVSERQCELLVAKVLQGHPWEQLTDEFGYHSIGSCRRALGQALAILTETFGDETALAERRALQDGADLPSHRES